MALFVIRFDNRDIGLSTKFEDTGLPDFLEINAAYSRGETPKVPYTLEELIPMEYNVVKCISIVSKLECTK
ncbi:unnamed protein product [marine sediment metagenome]|uniref:Uncharacterized protein n=1 Tax=marine sediment metagenome TaxID=412755 RepID=X1FWG2_9ZZZZ